MMQEAEKKEMWNNAHMHTIETIKSISLESVIIENNSQKHRTKIRTARTHDREAHI